ncbi:hypothetical protein CAL14_20350 [Bordetella genomosp. 9]|uniref:DUF2169 family type VI secretion system accessory protein n=1 Tax=Bordetella genomosp. 9 TaxID=1416803 RepID=UPI000A29371F|nr:DUF2169 domain-containing protein [Bordetella genomosp. 9]ARP92348.1 hypothetical protein CAL14_20350 [Bordetella genomosp. 9]
MRVVKPSRLSLLTRPYRWRGSDKLGIAMLAMATLKDAPALTSEQDLWRLAAQEVGGALDLGVPKPCAEFIVSGKAYTRHQPDKTACAVRARVGSLDKSLLVFGDRYWVAGKPTAPAPFDAMRIDWRRAYGGPDCPDNPHGIGMQPDEIGGMRVTPLPNVESPDQRIRYSGQIVRPAGFDGIAPDTPARFARMGSRYDQAWLEHEFPGFASDMDARYFNAAPSDQWWTGRPDVPSGADYAFWNMHPERQVLSGRLPVWRARCFALRHARPAVLEEADMRLTTAWFFPDHERAILIWHGVLDIAESDGADVSHLVLAIEDANDHRAIAHYMDVARRRADSRHGAVHALRDSDLVSASLYANAPDSDLPDVHARPLARNLQAGAARRRASSRRMLEAEGLNADDYLPLNDALPRRPTVDDLPAALEEAEQARREGEALLERGRQALLDDSDMRRFAQHTGVDLDAIARVDMQAPRAGRIDPPALVRQLRDFDERFPAATSAGPSPTGLRDRLQPQVLALYRHAAHAGAAAAPMPPQRAARTRRRVQAIYARGRDFSGLHLAGADLSGMDLRGSCFRGASLEGARLDGARLDDCDFTEAVLAHASMAGGSLANARLAHANAGMAHFEKVSLAGANLTRTSLEGARCVACVFSDAILHGTRLGETRLERCDFSVASMEEAVLMKTHFLHCAFEDAMLHRCAFMACTFEHANLRRAHVRRCGFIDTAFRDGADLTAARIEMSSFSPGTDLQSATLDSATLHQCGMRGVRMQGASLVKAVVRGSDLSECLLANARLDGIEAAESLFVRADFNAASLRGANLMQAVMSRADFTDADLRAANLFRADLGEAVLPAAAGLRGAYTAGTKTWPRRRAAAE